MLAVDGTMLSTAIVSLATAVGGFIGGRAAGKSTSSQIAAETVEMLQTQVDVLKGDKEAKDLMILDLQTRIEILESLVTQRAAVDEVHDEVQGVRGVVDRIAAKVGA